MMTLCDAAREALANAVAEQQIKISHGQLIDAATGAVAVDRIEPGEPWPRGLYGTFRIKTICSDGSWFMSEDTITVAK